MAIKPYYDDASARRLLMLGPITCSNFIRLQDEQLIYNATMVVMELAEASDEYLFKNQEKREFGTIASEYMAEYIRLW
jgi:hypothetical protein